MNTLTIGERIESVLDQRGLTQGWLSARTGVGQSHISMIIRGKVTPNVEYIIKIARALRVSLDWLATGEMWEQDALTPEEAQLIADLRAIREPMLRDFVLGAARDAARGRR